MEKVPANLKHHQRLNYCHSRPQYRSGRKLTAVKVYSVVNESRHLFVFGVPRINLKNEVKKLFQKYGTIISVENFSEEISKIGVKLEIFTDCYHIVYEKLENARKAKRLNDTKNFYGGVLHISYAPEKESVAETKEKLNKRQMEVNYRMKINNKIKSDAESNKSLTGHSQQQSAKRKLNMKEPTTDQVPTKRARK